MNLWKRFVQSEATGGIILILAACLALMVANGETTAHFYQQLIHLAVFPAVGEHGHNTVLFIINDILMAVFFLFVGMEVKQELVQGALSSREKAVFPIIAALGGMVAPGCLFLLFNGHHCVLSQGWAIPTATDIAFALGVLALLGSRVPAELKIFLMALAVIDDLGAIIIIALFYTQSLSLLALAAALALGLVLAGLNWRGVQNNWAYLIVGVGLWGAVLASGIHSTIAGVIIGLMIPVSSRSQRLSHGLSPWVQWAILPLFAFANAGVSVAGLSADNLLSSLPVGIIVGLLVGKPVGITLFCAVASKLKLAQLPQGATIKDIASIGLLCGIGFTMSVFIAGLAYQGQAEIILTEAKLGILLGSLLSAIIGYCVLRVRWRQR